jgi:hypothetical protein
MATKRPINFRVEDELRQEIEYDATTLHRPKEDVIGNIVRQYYRPKQPDMPADQTEWELAKAAIRFRRNMDNNPDALKLVCEILGIPVPRKKSVAKRRR